MGFEIAERLKALPPYLFAEIDRHKREALAAGRDIINFGIGDPDQPTPTFIIDAANEAIKDPKNHSYPLDQGCPRFRESVTAWFKRRFGVALSSTDEVLMLIGSKEGLAHLPLALINPGDTVLVPNPGYPAYQSAIIFAGGKPHEFPLDANNGWLPAFDAIPSAIAKEAKLMYLNYPNNPTGAVADLAFYEQAVAFAKTNDIIIAQDAAYSEVAFGARPPSILEVPGAKDVAIEFHSLSKTFNMTGWRIAFAVGNAEILSALGRIKSNLDSGQFTALQLAAAEALDHEDHVEVKALIDLYRERRDVLVNGLETLGIPTIRPQATFYVWTRIPEKFDSIGFAMTMLSKADVLIIPGRGFGDRGEGHVRFALTVPSQRISEAIERMTKGRFW